eukprot:m.180382 g.180382  ORF g.180382 m.180382 type:complete len:400 (-) comp32020_c0_seq1:440-1639(-)
MELHQPTPEEKSLGISTRLDLDNFEDEIVASRSKFVLNSPRSLRACRRFDVKPIELLPRSISEFKDIYGPAGYSDDALCKEHEWFERQRQSQLALVRAERALYISKTTAKANIEHTEVSTTTAHTLSSTPAHTLTSTHSISKPYDIIHRLNTTKLRSLAGYSTNQRDITQDENHRKSMKTLQKEIAKIDKAIAKENSISERNKRFCDLKRKEALGVFHEIQRSNVVKKQEISKRDTQEASLACKLLRQTVAMQNVLTQREEKQTALAVDEQKKATAVSKRLHEQNKQREIEAAQSLKRLSRALETAKHKRLAKDAEATASRKNQRFWKETKHSENLSRIHTTEKQQAQQEDLAWILKRRYAEYIDISRYQTGILRQQVGRANSAMRVAVSKHTTMNSSN